MNLAPFRALPIVLVAFAVCGIAAARAGEGVSAATIAPGALLIDGAPVRCGSTPALVSDDYPDYGAARPGLIILNPSRLKPLPPAARLLVYYHECAHQFVGRSELAADCWAVQAARRQGQLTRAGLDQACVFIGGLPADGHHPQGALRCSHMARCYDDTDRVRAAQEGPPDAAAEAAGIGFSSGFSQPPEPH